ncbi:uncharacterized protein LOC141651286 [Silene latifolia]|uniref:uncharacterized protein LOC141651286 n=1 Tax=Silene latifolia TaxID=37657 RepID=UPI003D782F76
MVWNIQGTGNRNKISALKEVVKTYKPSILALVETHMGGNHAENIRQIIGYDGHIRVDAIGFSGGIWVYWKTNLIKFEPVYEDSTLWTELENFARTNNKPWLMAEDFNETRSLDERHKEWGTIHEDASVRHLPAFQSDHCPLLIAPNGFAPLNSVQKSFRFQAAWMTHELFSTFIAEKWPDQGSFPTRLDELSKSLREWNKNVFGNIFCQKKSLLARIEGCQKKLATTREK